MENEQSMVMYGDRREVEVIKGYNLFSIPLYLRKVFIDELGEDSGRDHKLVVLAIHAILIESGFLSYDAVTKQKINGFQVLKKWPIDFFNLRLHYTLPVILNCASTGSDSIYAIVLKFHSLGKSVIVYGSVADADQSAVYRLKFNEDILVPVFNVVWANCGLDEEVTTQTSAGKEVIQFWNKVKDEMVFPLLIDLCGKAGLSLPACFATLPADVKVKILELLPGVDVARASCVSPELRNLASSDELWKKKYAERYGSYALRRQRDGDDGNWKMKFVHARGGRIKRCRLHEQLESNYSRRRELARRKRPDRGGVSHGWRRLPIGEDDPADRMQDEEERPPAVWRVESSGEAPPPTHGESSSVVPDEDDDDDESDDSDYDEDDSDDE